MIQLLEALFHLIRSTTSAPVILYRLLLYLWRFVIVGMTKKKKKEIPTPITLQI